MEKGGIFWNAWADLFQFHKSHANVEQTDQFWKKVHDDAIELEHKYKDTRAANFVPRVLIAILLELEAEEKSI